MITEHTYEIAKAKLAEYAARKDAQIKGLMLTFPPEMASVVKDAAIGSLKDVLADAYYELVLACNEIIEEFERNDLFEHQRLESANILEMHHA